ncbi:hypothetical protein HDU79_006558 [Rhizoclosmatium sp. JEL0117]|nr:hypothetical protein HDU79_006558 [Rhizoclosmatium sp. JEL0117]
MEQNRLFLIALVIGVLITSRPTLDTFPLQSSDGWIQSAAKWLSPKAYRDYLFFSTVTVLASNEIYLGILGFWIKLPIQSVMSWWDHLVYETTATLDRLPDPCFGGCGSGFCFAGSRPYTLVLAPFFHSDTFHLVFTYLPFYQYAQLVETIIGSANASAAILWCGVCGRLMGIVSGLRIIIAVQVLRYGGGIVGMDERDVVTWVGMETLFACWSGMDVGVVLGGAVGALGFLYALSLK